MQFNHEGMSLWYGMGESSATNEIVQAGTEVTIKIGVQPIDASNTVEVQYRINKGQIKSVAAKWLYNDSAGKAQYFRVKLPALSAGDIVEYTIINRCAGRQVPSPEEAKRFASSFRVIGSETKPKVTNFPQAARVPKRDIMIPQIPSAPIGIKPPIGLGCLPNLDYPESPVLGTSSLMVNGSIGVEGYSNSNFGVAGRSFYSDGVHGSSCSGNGVLGSSESGIGIYGSGGNLAGQFDGHVHVNGNHKVIGDATVTGNHNVTGDVKVTGDVILVNEYGADCSEDFDVEDNAEAITPGTVLVIGNEGKLTVNSEEYDPRIAGVVSGAGDFRPAILLHRINSKQHRLPIALIGKTFCKVDATPAPIKPGDLLTTSSTPGHAMKVLDRGRAIGAILGKALDSLEHGQGLIPILVSLR